MTTAVQPRLTVSGVTKRFQGQKALDGATLELEAGEIHALIGQNGSGKSTLIKILAGYHRPDEVAESQFDGHPYDLGSPAAARANGLRFIHQDLGLIGALDSVDNLALGERYNGKWWLSDRREREASERLLRDYGLSFNVSAPVHSLSAAQQSMLAIVRSLSHQETHGGVLVLDEPTAALPEQEVQQLFELLAEVRRRGTAILYVTHRLAEVFKIATRVTVLRDGRNVGTRDIAELDHDSLVSMMIGRSVGAFYPDPPERSSQVVLRVQELAGGSVRRASLAANRGEIVGVTGLLGSGYEQLLALIYGSQKRTQGDVTVDGVSVEPGSLQHAITAGIAYAPADRKRFGSWPDWTLRENLTAPSIPSRGPLKWLAARTESRDAAPWLAQVDVVPADPEYQFSSLSGGNQQKVVLARWLRHSARVFLLEEPTNGVDIAAKHAIYAELVTAVSNGACVLLSSSDIEELCAVCDRVLIMRGGRICATLEGERLTEDEVLIECTREDEQNQIEGDPKHAHTH